MFHKSHSIQTFSISYGEINIKSNVSRNSSRNISKYYIINYNIQIGVNLCIDNYYYTVYMDFKQLVFPRLLVQYYKVHSIRNSLFYGRVFIVFRIIYNYIQYIKYVQLKTTTSMTLIVPEVICFKRLDHYILCQLSMAKERNALELHIRPQL